MKKLLVTLALLIPMSFASSAEASLDLIEQNPETWEVVKETRHYLIVEMKSDLQAEVVGRHGTYQVSYREGERRVFLKGRDYRATLKSDRNYRVRQTIEVRVKDESISQET